MKAKHFLFVVVVVSLFLQNCIAHSSGGIQINQEPTKSTAPATLRPLNIVFAQDVSKSIQKNGVVVATSAVFTPYYYDINRDIELSFTVISDLSAHPLITVLLPEATFTRPAYPDLSSYSLVDQQDEKKKYNEELQKYISDSAQFYLDRHKKFTDFCTKVDTLTNSYRKHLTNFTDLKTALEIADRNFSYCAFGTAKNILLINSDGLDSGHRKVKKLNNDCKVVLISANAISHTDIDSIVTITLQSPEQAISYSINNN